MKRRAVLFCLGSAAAAAAAVGLKPRHRAAETLPPIELESQIPARFGGWSIDTGLVPVLPNPELQAKLDTIYTQVVARTYVNAEGQRVMLSIAYGADQATDATAAHRPEFCYTAQGFVMKPLGEQTLRVDGRTLVARRLLGNFGARVEPVTYWVTLNDMTVLPGASRKLQQIRLGLQGQIPDGMLFRVSNIGADYNAGFALQDSFIAALAQAMQPQLRDRYFGKSRA